MKHKSSFIHQAVFVSRKIQKGFTLIELMIVVAIVDVLIVAALLAYQDDMTRDELSEMLLFASSEITAASEALATLTTLPFATSSNLAT